MPQRDSEARRQYMRMWRERNPDKVRANDLRDRARQKEYRQNNKARYAEYQRASRAKNPKQHLIYQARSRALRDGLPCDVTLENMSWPTHCPILGIELCYEKTPVAERKKDWQLRSSTATLDRRDNPKGYVQGNVFVISHRANRIKSDATIEELEAVLRYMKGR